MPLTEFQRELARLLSAHRSPDSYLAGEPAIHLEPNTTRYSNDLDYFQDSVERVANAFNEDVALLESAGYQVTVSIQQPGFVSAVVRRAELSTKVEWAHDSAWRFLPTISDETVGFRLHPIDLAINKVLALVGRNEARDFLDALYVHAEVLPLGALCWAAAGKDPGYTPQLLLDLLRRRGKYQPEDFARLHLERPLDLPELRRAWSAALESAETFIESRPPTELGCLYYDVSAEKFVEPSSGAANVVPHFGRPGGVMPRVAANAP